MSGRITTEQQVRVEVRPLTAAGNPAPIDGNVVWATSDDTVADFEPIDATSAMVRAVGPGVALIGAAFDADLGDGVRSIQASGALEVVTAEAVVGQIVFGEPELIPPAE